MSTVKCCDSNGSFFNSINFRSVMNSVWGLVNRIVQFVKNIFCKSEPVKTTKPDIPALNVNLKSSIQQNTAGDPGINIEIPDKRKPNTPIPTSNSSYSKISEQRSGFEFLSSTSQDKKYE